MTDVNIPEQALEAAGKAIADEDCPPDLFDVCVAEHGGCQCRDQARAACIAMLAAWPGAYDDAHGKQGHIILPLSENPNDKA